MYDYYSQETIVLRSCFLENVLMPADALGITFSSDCVLPKITNVVTLNPDGQDERNHTLDVHREKNKTLLDGFVHKLILRSQWV